MTTGTIFDYLAHGPAETADASTVAAFKPGEKAEHAEGLLYMGPWETLADGFAEHTRRCARALALTGVPVHLRSLNQDNLKADTPEMEPVEKVLRPLLRASITKYAAQIYQVVPFDSLLQFLTTHREYLPEQMQMLNAHRVLYTVWERDRISDAARSAFARVGQVWVACDANADMLVENGVQPDKVRIVPCPYFEDDPLLTLRGRDRKPGVVRFYHIGKWEPRKAQDRIIGAFLLAFRPGEAELYLKVSPLSVAAKVDGFARDPMIAIHDWLKDDRVKAMGWTLADMQRALRVITQRLMPADIVKLHALCDVYVSLSRGEGFDMPAQDAKLAGNLLVYTPSGGTQAFAGDRDFKVPATGRVLCHSFYGWNRDAGYIDYDIEEAARQMRLAAIGVTVHDRQPHVDLQWMEAGIVGRHMRACVDQVIEEGRHVAKSYASAVLAREQAAKEVASQEPQTTPSTVARVGAKGPRILFASHGASLEAPYGGARVNALLIDLLKRHPLLGEVEVVMHDVVSVKPDIAMVEVPTGVPYLERIGASRIVLLRYGDQGHGACAFQLFERGANAVVVVPTEFAYRTLGYGIPYQVIYNAFEPPDVVAQGGKRGKKVLYAGVYRFAKDTPLAAKVASLAPDLGFVWRKSTDIHEAIEPIAVPPNVTLLEATSNRDELWDGVGCVLVTSRYESFCLIAYEAMCRGIPVVYHERLESITEWAGKTTEWVGKVGGLYLCGTAAAMAAACRDAIWNGASDGPLDKSIELANRVHQTSLRQLDAFIRTFLLAPEI
jgi:glycosyltransferase involved in cell wall biosynthesis